MSSQNVIGGDPQRSVAQIAAGSSHTIARLDTGEVVAWGRGEDGQLGLGDAQERSSPVVVPSLTSSQIDMVTCGAEYSIAVSREAKQLLSWGWGDFGRLGHGEANDIFIPQPVSAFSGRVVQNVACGDTHTLVTTDDGVLFAFGRNQNGQLGLGTNDDAFLPRVVEKLKGSFVSSIAAGAEHSVVSLDNGEVYAWGWGRYGNLGDGSIEDRWEPTKVLGLEGVKVTKVCCGWRHSCAIDDKGVIFTFGWSKYGQLGHGDFKDSLIPKAVESLKDKAMTMIAGGWRHTIAGDADGKLYGWGWNKFGQLGNGTNEDANAPKLITTLESKKAKLISCGWRHTVAVTEDGQVYSWGRGVHGQLGHGELVDLNLPKLLEVLSTPNIDVKALERYSAPSSAVIPLADRYAVVPDSNVKTVDITDVPEVPQMKKQRLY
eukprot:jgi/Botrbrau1/21800/Bobra.0190s0025.2